MPFYKYKCKICGNEFEKLLSISSRNDPLSEECEKCGSKNCIERTIDGVPLMGDPVRLGIKTPDSGFKEVLSKIHEKTAGSKLNETTKWVR